MSNFFSIVGYTNEVDMKVLEEEEVVVLPKTMMNQGHSHYAKLVSSLHIPVCLHRLNLLYGLLYVALKEVLYTTLSYVICMTCHMLFYYFSLGASFLAN